MQNLTPGVLIVLCANGKHWKNHLGKKQEAEWQKRFVLKAGFNKEADLPVTMGEERCPVPTLVPQVYFGVSPEVSGCGAFLDDYTFAHISGRLLITEDFRTREQKFSQLPKFGHHHLISAVAFDSKRTIIVVADEGDPPTLNVYRLKDHENILTFVPKDCRSERFTCMFVHSDCERISALLGPPDDLIYTLHLRHKCVEAMTPALPKDVTTRITQIVGHQEDTFHYAVLGIGLLRFVTWMGDIWEDVFHSFNKAEGIPITCGTYTAIDTLLVGTADGNLMLISYDGIKGIYDPLTIDRFFIEIKKKGVKSSPPLEPPAGNVITDGFESRNEIQFLQAFKRGIIYMVKGEKEETIHVMLKGRFGDSPPYWIADTSYTPTPEDDKFPKHGFIKIHVGSVEEYATLHEATRPLYVTTNIAINFSGKCIALTFTGRFIMVLDVRDDFDPPKRLPTAHLLSFGYNKCPVDHVASCILKNVFITACEKTVKLYDYSKKESYIMFTFEDNIHSISLHPTGCYGLLSFADRTVLFGLQQQTFLPIVEMNVECCKNSAFSNGGDLMVIAEETKLRVYSVYSFQQISEINDGEAGKISGIKLCPQNNHIWTSRSTGAVVQTNIKDGIMKYFFSSSPKASFDEFDNFRRIYFTGFDGTIEELDTTERRITQKIHLRHGNLTDLIIAKSWNVIIIGTETGYVLVFSCPLEIDATPLYKVKMHYSPIMKIALSKDETRLFTSAKDGSICIWKLVYKNNEKRWNGVYVKSEGFPIPSNYKETSDQFSIQRLVDLEKSYFSRQEKLMMTKTKCGILTDLESLLDCLKAYELRGVLHLPTKLRRFKHRDYWRRLHNKGRDHLLEEQSYNEKFIKDLYTQTSDYIDVYKYYDEKEIDYKIRYISRMKDCYKEINKCLSGVPFHDVKGNVLSQIRQQKQFCEILKAKSKKILKEIEIKGRNFIEMKTSPTYLKYVKKEKEARYKAKQLMSTVLHRKVLKILKLFKAINEVKKICAERATQKTGNASVKSLRDSGSVTDSLSYIHSDDPSDSVNVDFTYLIKNSPTNSVTGDDPGKAKKVVWPQVSPEKYSHLKKKIQECRKGKIKPLAIQEGGSSKSEIKPDGEEVFESEGKLPRDDSSESEQILDTFVIKRADRPLSKHVKKVRTLQQIRQPLKRKGYGHMLSKLQTQREKNLKLIDWLKEWIPGTSDSIKIPLIQEKCAFFMRSFPQNWSNMKSDKNKNTPFKGAAAHFEVFPKMFNNFRHLGKFINQVTPFHALKRRIRKGKFRDILLSYSPSSKLSKLAVKNLIISKKFLPKCSTEIINNLWPGKGNFVEYDPFSDFVIVDKQTFFPSSVLEFTQLSYFIPQKQQIPKENVWRQKTHKAVAKSTLPYTSFSNELTEYRKIKLANNWEKLRQAAYPFSGKYNGITPFTPTEEYHKLFESVFKRNLELPMNALPVLRELMKGQSYFYKRSFQERINKHAIFPVKDIWVLKSVNAINHLKLPFANLSNVEKIKSVKKSNIHELYNENKDSSDLFCKSEFKRTYMRVGTVDQLSRERLNYGICHKDKWDLFNPPISKNLMSVLIGTDFLHDLEQSSHQSTSEKNTESDCYAPDASETFDKEIILRQSDTDLWKSYFAEEERVLKLLDVFEPFQVGSQSMLSDFKLQPSEGPHLSGSSILDTSDSQCVSTPMGEVESFKKSNLNRGIFFENDVSTLFVVPNKKELGIITEKYIELMKKYEIYFLDSNLFPSIKILKLLEYNSEFVKPDEGSELYFRTIAKASKVTGPNEPTKKPEKDGCGKRKSIINSAVFPKSGLLKRQFDPNTPHRDLSIKKVTEWLADSNKKNKRKYSTGMAVNIKPAFATTHSANHKRSRYSDKFSGTGEFQPTNGSSALECESKYVQSTSSLKKDGCEEEMVVEKEKTRKLWERVYNATFSFPEEELRNVTTPFNVRLWTKLFHSYHPKTVESFEDFNCNLKGQEEFQFKSVPDMSYGGIYKESLPKKKHSDDPSDEIETVSSLQYIAIEEPSNKMNSYSLFTKQKVRIKTSLKSKVWFIPDDKNNSEGRFYYPGNPDWHKGFISPLLITQRTICKEDVSKIKKDTSHTAKKQNIFSGNTYKSYKTNKPYQKFVSIQYKQIATSFGFIYLLPFKYKKFWTSLKNSVGSKLMLILRSAMKRNKKCKKDQKFKLISPLEPNVKPLIVTYNRSLINILSDRDKRHSSKPSCPPGSVICSRAALSATSSSSSTSSDSSQLEDRFTEAGMFRSTRMGESKVSRGKNELSFKSRIKNQSRFSSRVNVLRKKSYFDSEDNVSHEANHGRAIQLEELYVYQEGLEWGMYKNFVVKINKPHIFNSVKRLDKALFKWMKSYLEKYSFGSWGKVRKSYPSVNDVCHKRKYDSHVKAILKVYWPDDLLKPKKIDEGSPERDLACRKDDLRNTSRKVRKWLRHRDMRTAMDMCTKRHSFIPEDNRIKMSNLPKNFNLQTLDGNYHILRKLRESFIARRLRKIQNYCIYRSNNRRPFLQQNIRNASFSERQKFYQQKLRKSEEFFREYTRHKSHILVCLQNVKEAKSKFDSALHATNEKWDHLQGIKDDILKLLQMFSHDRNLTKIKEATKAAIGKYKVDEKMVEERRLVQRDYEKLVVSQLKSLKEEDMSENSLSASVTKCKSQLQQVQDEINAHLQSRMTPQSAMCQDDPGRAGLGNFYSFMEEMSAKLRRQENSLKDMRHFLERKEPGGIAK